MLAISGFLPGKNKFDIQGYFVKNKYFFNIHRRFVKVTKIEKLKLLSNSAIMTVCQ